MVFDMGLAFIYVLGHFCDSGDCGNPCIWAEEWCAVHDEWVKSLLHPPVALHSTKCTSNTVWVSSNSAHNIRAGGHHISPWTPSILHIVP